jgi:beta-1,4-mannosyl-glycoprotein beta-1,4-N-acetylglucosaminyltransferase
LEGWPEGRAIRGDPVKVFDTFPLGYESDVLLIRLLTLADVVDEFCIVEADTTYAGRPREYLWPKLLELHEFQQFAERVQWQPVDLASRGGLVSPWERETILRGAMLDLVDDCGASGGDVVIVSDADEIPNPRIFAAWGEIEDRIWRAPGYYHQLRLDLRASGSLQPGIDRKNDKLPFGYLWEHRQPLIGPRRLFRHAQKDRELLQTAVPNVAPELYGWHLTCQGTPADIVDKLQSYSHTELARTREHDIERLIRTRTSLAHGVALEMVPWPTLPPPVAEDPDRWMHLMTPYEKVPEVRS